MNEPKSLDSLFSKKIFRIPDYQRGYAWQQEQLKAFWEDLINLSDERFHYTGVLTLKEISKNTIGKTDREFWLLDEHSYRLYHIVDGQQRLTTFVVFIQAYVDFFRGLPENQGKPDDEIYITDSLNLETLQSSYLYKNKPKVAFRTYKFGYTEDNPSYDFLRYRILGEEGGGLVQETFYTLNLSNAKRYFTEQLSELYRREGVRGLQEAYKKLTKQFLFNEYVIKDDFDVFVAFETMNNRGKKLSDLELLKNRLIYLTTLYKSDELDDADRKGLREAVNETWKEVYHQLGRNKTRPLNDDDFLRAHWISYFKYSRQTGRDYAKFLLEEQFTPQNIHKRIEREVALEAAEEQRSESEVSDFEDADAGIVEETRIVSIAQLQPQNIHDYVLSLRTSSVHWFNSFYSHLALDVSEAERLWIDRLNRVGMGYFRPLVMVILKSKLSVSERVHIFERIERFIFLAFRMTSARSNYRSSEFYNFARGLDRNEASLDDISKSLDEALAYTFNQDGTLRIDEFYNILFKKFGEGSGYYGWSGIRYVLYEYEYSLLSASRQKKVDWESLLKSEKDKISIEHIYPQTPTDLWEASFTGITLDARHYYNGTIGNLLLLSMSINASLQNDSFNDKKCAKFDSAGRKTRNGYADGSHSEIEVARYASWGPSEIKERGHKLLKFMEERWGFKFGDNDREKLLFLDSHNEN